MIEKPGGEVKSILQDPKFRQKSMAYMALGVLVSALYRERADSDLALQTIRLISDRIDEIPPEELEAATSFTQLLTLLVPEAFRDGALFTGFKPVDETLN